MKLLKWSGKKKIRAQNNYGNEICTNVMRESKATWNVCSSFMMSMKRKPAKGWEWRASCDKAVLTLRSD